MKSVTVCAVTGVDPEGHQAAIDRTIAALPFPAEKRLHVVGGMSYEEYSRFMVKDLHRLIQTDLCINVQADGYAVHPECWDDTFLEYDYIGAPWSWGDKIGNGGVSLRSRRFLDISSCLPDPELPEDMWLCAVHRDFMEQNGIRFAPQEVAAAFSFEHLSPLIQGHDPSKAWAWHGPAFNK